MEQDSGRRARHADGLRVHDPVFGPYVLVDTREESGLFQVISEIMWCYDCERPPGRGERNGFERRIGRPGSKEDRGVGIEQDAMKVIGWEEGTVRTPGCPEEGLPAQEVVVAQKYGRRGPGEELPHGRSRVPAIDQVTADQDVDWRQKQGLIASAQAREMGDAIVLQLLSAEGEGAGGEVVEVEVAAEAANHQGLQANPRPED